nr:DUF5682 family protein [Streptomyces sp. ODS25]
MLLGVRHHGPGSARAVRAALDEALPQAVLIEGPPEADALVPLAAQKEMRPPVALLAHVVDEPGRSAFWPFAEFSPEWVALQWALSHDVAVRFIDLPAAHTLAWRDRAADTDAGEAGADPGEAGAGEGDAGTGEGHGGADTQEAVRIDPLAVLAETAGYDDPERWWEDVVEHRGVVGDAFAPFEALADAMTALRETYGDGEPHRDLVREAYMRLQVRAARRQFGDAIAVVCGAWHVPALKERSTAAGDRALLKGLPKVKADMTWVPWTHRRLSKDSGYGAGIDSPGWYGHLFRSPDRPLERWMTKVAGLLREEDRIVSSAHVIEAVRLADALATLRGRPLAGLAETSEAVKAVMCDGSEVPLALVHDRLVVGDVLGEVPENAPAVPLQRDLARQQRALRLKPAAAERELDLDLRRDTDAARSRLLHRLRLLGVPWGEPAVSARGSTGTFRETWRLCWEPELSVRVAEAGVWGTTASAAAAAKAAADAAAADTLADVTALAEQCLLADLPEALPVVMRTLADRAALDADVGHLAQALPALVRSVRYGDVRGTDTGALGDVAAGLAERIFVGLPPACASLDADAAAEMRRHLDAVHGAVGLLEEAREAPATPDPAVTVDDAAHDAAGAGAGAGENAEVPHAPDDGGGQREPGVRSRWHAVLRGLAERESMPGVLRGRSARILLDEGDSTQDEAARRMGLALSPGTEPADAAAWIDGFVGGGAGSGMLLVHDERLLALVDGWLAAVSDIAFTDVLPLLRRTFSAYEAGVRRTLGELIRRGPAGAPAAVTGSGAALPGFAPELDVDRADAVLPVLSLLLGLPAPDGPPGRRTRTGAGIEAGTGTDMDAEPAQDTVGVVG